MSVTSTTPPSSSSPKVWLITGCSTGIGRELALAALAHGDFVIATARNVCKLEDLVNLGASGIALDVTASDEIIEQIVADAAKIHGRIDILVNNAGYTLEGAIEECNETEVYDQFNTNVFGMARMLRAVMPYLRAQKSGVVANIGSMAGWCASPAGGWYCATKFAIAGLSEALRFEVAHLGIDVTSVDLGSFRTSLLGGNMIVAKKHIAELDPATETTKQLLASRNGSQAGDPAKAAMLLVEALTKSGRCAGRAIPSRLVVGKDAVKVVGAALQKGQDELNAWADLGATTNFDDIIVAP